MKLKDFDFRIWDSNTNKFVEVLISDNIRAVPRNNDNNDNIEIELWSGFRDKNRINIYENDILRDSQGDRYVVSICDESRSWILLKLDLSPCCSLIEILQEGYVEVIGNIHENAELLKEKVLVKCKYGDMYDSKGFPKY